MPELEQKKTLIAEKLLENNKNITTVLRKAGARSGTFRTQPLEFLAGEDTRITTVIENGVKLKVNVEDAYYSVRMSTERKRILDMIERDEHILCMFSGVGPYPVTFSAHSPAERIVGIEINPAAHELAVENVAKNRCTNVRLLEGDVHEIVPKLADNEELFDRITMPLPESAKEFLDDAISVSKKGTIIHYYTFVPEGEFDTAVRDIQHALERNGKRLESYDVVKVGQYAPREWRVCVDARVG